MAKKEFEWPDYACPKCGLGKQWLVGAAVNSGGQPVNVFFCGHCSHRTTHFANRDAVKKAGVEPVPLVTEWERPCCGLAGRKAQKTTIGHHLHYLVPSQNAGRNHIFVNVAMPVGIEL